MVNQSNRRIIIQITASLLFSIIFFMIWPTNIVWDDAGIILKYMDNFAEGYFYSYNPQDGPVFGISGFLHGILAGFFAYTHLFSPLNCLFASNFIGLTLVSFHSLRLLSYFCASSITVFVYWIALMLCAPSFVICVKQGLETPLHLAMILSSIYLFLLNKLKWMWLFFVLAMISKLDAVPIVAFLAVAFFIRNYYSIRPTPLSIMLKDMILYAVIPGLLWLAFTFIVFGSPMPQTAYAKLYYHENTTSFWYPYLLSFSLSAAAIRLFILSFVVYLFYVFVSKRKTDYYSVLLFGFSVVAYIALYYFYNPKERMPWYYAVPEYLIIFQIIIIANAVLDRFLGKWRLALGICFAIFLGFICFPAVYARAEKCLNYLSHIETERIVIGEWVREHSDPLDVLFTGHGHVARNAGLYAVDVSGLDSKTTTDHERKIPQMIQELKPDWIVQHGLLKPNMQIRNHYCLRKSFYNLAALSRLGAWRIYEKCPEEDPRIPMEFNSDMCSVLSENSGVNEDQGHLFIRGSSITIHELKQHFALTAFWAGVQKENRSRILSVSFLGNNLELLGENEIEIPSHGQREPAKGFYESLEVPINPEWGVYSIIVRPKYGEDGAADPIVMIDPILLKELPKQNK